VRSFALGFIAALLLLGVFLAGYAAGSGRSRGSEAQTPEFDILFQVQDLLQANFLGDIPEAKQQVYGAIRGLAESYRDPYTVFVEPAAREVERDELKGHFGGIGAQLGRDDTGNMVLTVCGSPSARAGVTDGTFCLRSTEGDHPANER
jgi:carboxyl-terminal processing protease